MNTKEFLSQLETETLNSPASVIFKDQEGFYERTIVDEITADFEKASADNPEIVFGVIKGEEDGVKMSIFKDGKNVFERTENSFETEEDATKFFEAMVEYGVPEEGTEEYEKMKEEYELTEKYAVDLEDGDVEYFEDEQTAKDFVAIEKDATGNEYEIRTTLEPVDPNKFVDKEAVLETKTEMLNDNLERLREELELYRDEEERMREEVESKRFDYIREVYEESDEDTKEYLLNEDKDFKRAIENLEVTKEKLDDTEQKIEELEKEIKDMAEKEEDVLETVEESDDVDDEQEDVDRTDDEQEDVDDDYEYDEDLEL